MATVCDWLKISRNFLNQSEVKSKPIPTCLAFSRAWRGCLVVALESIWYRLSILWLAEGLVVVTQPVLQEFPVVWYLSSHTKTNAVTLKFFPAVPAACSPSFYARERSRPSTKLLIAGMVSSFEHFQGSHSLKRSFSAINHWKVLEFETLIPVFQNMSVLRPQKVAQICSPAIPQVKWPEAVGRW